MKRNKKIAKTTIIDIAKASGVSVSTVSRILNDKPDVAEETRERVLNVIKEQGFTPQAPWQQLASGKSRFITLHYPKNPNQPHTMNSFVMGAALACEKAGYSLNLVVSSLDENALLGLFRSGQTDGMILMEIFSNDWRVDSLRRNQVPFVMIGHCEDNTGLTFVDLDIEHGIHLAVEHLAGLGHCRIGFVLAEPYSFTGIEPANRFGYSAFAQRGYESACANLAIPVISTQVWAESESVENKVWQLLDENPGLTAIVASSEAAVPGIIQAVQSRKIRVPEDLSIVGAADTHMAGWTTPPLTALSYQADTAGLQAAELLIDRLEGRLDEPRQILLPFELIVRGSTGPARKE
jgi:DNA-binding LacI/PurR family transcriptional regulator